MRFEGQLFLNDKFLVSNKLLKFHVHNKCNLNQSGNLLKILLVAIILCENASICQGKITVLVKRSGVGGAKTTHNLIRIHSVFINSCLFILRNL